MNYINITAYVTEDILNCCPEVILYGFSSCSTCPSGNSFNAFLGYNTCYIPNRDELRRYMYELY